MLLARILVPSDFGIFGMAMSVVGLLLLFRDGGVEAAMLHRDRLDAEDLASLACLNGLLGLGLAILCALLAPILAWAYHEPRLMSATLLLCGCFVVYGLDVQPGALLLRNHRFKAYAWIDFLALVTGLAVALGLALHGAGYWSLFGMEVTVSLGLLIGHWSGAHWRMRMSLHIRRGFSFVRFGRDVSVVRALGHASTNIDNILIGLTLGPAALAFYNKAFRLISMPQEGVNWPLTRIAVPTLSRLRDRPAAYVAAFRRLNLISVGLGMPWVVLFVLTANPLVRVVYGDQWGPCVPLLQWLGAMGLCNTFLQAGTWVYISTGTVHRQVRWEIANLTGLTIAFAVGLHWGLEGVAAAASVAYTTLRLPALWYCFRGTNVTLRDLAAVIWRPAVATAIGAVGVLTIRLMSPEPAGFLYHLVRDAGIFSLGYTVGWLVLPGWKTFLRRELGSPLPRLKPSTASTGR